MLVNSNSLLQSALKQGYAIPAYNINNLEWTRYILEACNEDKSPVILGVSPSAIKYFGGFKVVYSIVTNLIDELNITVPVVLHLDHGKSVQECKSAIDSGFTSVMLDASDLDTEENVNQTKMVVEYAKQKGVSVEAELGELDKNDLDNPSTNIEEALDFVSETGIDSLAPSIGNIHGVYKESPNIEFELLGQLCKRIKIPMVLHGASGLDENKLKTAIFCGVCKININTDLQIAWSQGLKQYIKENITEYDPRKIILSGMDNLKKVVHQKNDILRSKGKAI